ncbi:MAG: DUF4234 domain-containing protein [Planctomycetota bacterium]
MARPEPTNLSDENRSHRANIALYLILTIITCGIFNLYWNYRQMEACNDMLGRREFSWGSWFLLSIITCGIYHIYYQYKMGAAIVEIQQKRQGHAEDSLPVISVMVTILGLSIIADAIHQSKINQLCT